ncbi:MAG: hypothetical protein M3162_02900 [Thermoproteota archaeon]|nr:hypothetical protein [Thermoproteota archaeon]
MRINKNFGTIFQPQHYPLLSKKCGIVSIMCLFYLNSIYTKEACQKNGSSSSNVKSIQSIFQSLALM